MVKSIHQILGWADWKQDVASYQAAITELDYRHMNGSMERDVYLMLHEEYSKKLEEAKSNDRDH